MIAIIGGLIIVGGAAVAGLRFLFSLSSKVESITKVLEKQTTVQEDMVDKLGDMKSEFGRFAGATEARLDSMERENDRRR